MKSKAAKKGEGVETAVMMGESLFGGEGKRDDALDGRE